MAQGDPLTPATALKRVNQTQDFNSDLSGTSKFHIRTRQYPKQPDDTIIQNSTRFEDHASVASYLRHSYTDGLGITGDRFWASCWVRRLTTNPAVNNFLCLGSASQRLWMYTPSLKRHYASTTLSTGSELGLYYRSRQDVFRWDHLVIYIDGLGSGFGWINGHIVWDDTSVGVLDNWPNSGNITVGLRYDTTPLVSQNANQEVCGVGIGKGAMTQALVDKLFNNGLPPKYSQFSETDKNSSNLDLISYFHLDEEGTNTRVDSHGNYDLDQVSQVSQGKIVMADFPIESDASIDEDSGLLSTGSKPAGIDIVAMNASPYSTVLTSRLTQNTDYTLEVFLDGGNVNHRPYDSIAELSAAGGWIEWIVPWDGCGFEFHPVSGTSGKPYILYYTYAFRDYDSSNVNHSTSFFYLKRGDKCRLRLKTGGQIEWFVNGHLVHTTTYQDWSVDSYYLRIRDMDNAQIGDKVFPPITGGNGVAEEPGWKQSFACITEQENDLILDTPLMDIDPSKQTEADAAEVSTWLNHGVGNDGTSQSGRHTTKVNDRGGFAALDTDEDSQTEFLEILTDMGFCTMFVVIEKKSTHDFNETLFSTGSSGSEAYFPYSDGKIRATIANDTRVVGSQSNSMSDFEEPLLFEIVADVDDWKSYFKGVLDGTDVSCIPISEESTFSLGNRNTWTNNNTVEAYWFRFLLYRRKFNAAEMEQQRRALEILYNLSTAPLPPGAEISAISPLIIGNSLTPTLIDDMRAVTYEWRVNGIIRSTNATPPDVTQWLVKGNNTIKLTTINTYGTTEHEITVQYDGKTITITGNPPAITYNETMPVGIKTVSKYRAKDEAGNKSGWSDEEELIIT